MSLLTLPILLLVATQSATVASIIHVGDASGLPLPGMTVTIGGCLPAPGVSAVTDAIGQVHISDLPDGESCRATVTGLAGMQPITVEFIPGNDNGPVRVTVQPAFTDQVTVTEQRGAQLIRETPASLGTISRETIANVAPTHPGQLLGQVAGVWVNTTGGEGHQTAIRQPLTTSPVYLYLEDGVPTRSTGFFNHNALYEVNVPAAAGVEVTKGPGSVLYGSDAIGGVVNVLTRSPLESPAWNVSLEGGQFGWARVLAGGNIRHGQQGLRVDLNLTRTDGWRDATGYDRQSGTVRWDRAGTNGGLLKALVTFSRIDQQTAGSSVLAEADYLSNPTRNLTPISQRDVSAFRASIDYTRVAGRTVWNVIPYVRHDSMGLLANWSLPYDPTDADTENMSYGVLTRVQRDLSRYASLAAGADLDVSPGSRLERAIVPATELTPDGRRIFAAYTDGPTVYDYDVTYAGLSPYAQIDWAITPRLRAQTGVRFDFSRYDYVDHLDTPPTARHQRPDDAVRTFSRATPKLGVTYSVSDVVSVFASYRDAFRAPSEGQLFRQGSARNTVDLVPVKATNVEGGIRLSRGLTWNVDASVYRLVKRDDILSFRDPVSGATEAVNAGRTDHAGVEVTAAWQPHRVARLSAAWSYARHRYVDWIVDPAAGLDYSGREMELAPRSIGNVTLTLMPAERFHVALESSVLGSYYLDAANTETYDGHVVTNARVRLRLHPSVELNVRALNLADVRYAESGSYTLARGREFAPGMPRTIYVGLGFDWMP